MGDPAERTERELVIRSYAPASEVSEEFLQGMAARMDVSFHKYGRVKDAYPHTLDALKSMADRIAKYRETGNTEWLIDAANFCLAPSTNVLTADLRWVAIGELGIGDQLVGFTEDPVTRRTQRAWRRSEVVAVERLQLPCCRVTLSTGTEIIASTDHRWLTAMRQGPGWSYRWLPTGSDERTGLRQRGRHFLPRIMPVAHPLNDYDSGWLAGFLDGEGHANQSGGRLGTLKVVWGQNPGSTLDRVHRILKEREYDVAQAMTRRCVVGSIRGGMHESMRLLMETRPVRLLERLDADRWGAVRQHAVDEVVSVEPVGPREVVAIGTASRTFVAEGYGHHNCMIEYMHPSHPEAHFRATDSDESPGRVSRMVGRTQKGNLQAR